MPTDSRSRRRRCAGSPRAATPTPPQATARTTGGTAGAPTRLTTPATKRAPTRRRCPCALCEPMLASVTPPCPTGAGGGTPAEPKGSNQPPAVRSGCLIDVAEGPPPDGPSQTPPEAVRFCSPLDEASAPCSQDYLP